MGKKIDAAVTALCILGIVLIPVLRSDGMPRLLEWIGQMEWAEIGLWELFWYIVLGIPMIPAFWIHCVAKHYWTNMLIMAALAALVAAVRKIVQTVNRETPMGGER